MSEVQQGHLSLWSFSGNILKHGSHIVCMQGSSETLSVGGKLSRQMRHRCFPSAGELLSELHSINNTYLLISIVMSE